MIRPFGLKLPETFTVSPFDVDATEMANEKPLRSPVSVSISVPATSVIAMVAESEGPFRVTEADTDNAWTLPSLDVAVPDPAQLPTIGVTNDTVTGIGLELLPVVRSLTNTEVVPSL